MRLNSMVELSCLGVVGVNWTLRGFSVSRYVPVLRRFCFAAWYIYCINL